MPNAVAEGAESRTGVRVSLLGRKKTLRQESLCRIPAGMMNPLVRRSINAIPLFNFELNNSYDSLR
ncbi:hypothetical protein J2Z32_001674 [Paenibacillus turicensis]|uniref:Uncharacterized protein n=1 Tax=Paenibacillus turicensis TaxID=160487 RepID=A0ABS4FR36_9BACL|nr:hypothetical protein [Paenibacillus turicensis]